MNFDDMAPNFRFEQEGADSTKMNQISAWTKPCLDKTMHADNLF